MKQFTAADVEGERIQVSKGDLVDSPPQWMKMGLQETASGYGRRLNTGKMIHYGGRLYRLYATCYSNAASVWFKTRGRTIWVS